MVTIPDVCPVSVPIGTPRQNVSTVPSTPNSVNTKPKHVPRTGKKALAAAEQEKREVYARELFIELNRDIFKDGLPKGTKLNWSKRLLTTAGKAKWHR